MFKVTALFKVPVMPVLLIIDIQLTIPASLFLWENRVFIQDWHFLTFSTGPYPFSTSVEDLWGT